MKKKILIVTLTTILLVFSATITSAQTIVKKGEKYDTIIRKHVDNPVTKGVAKPKPAPKPPVEIILPSPEYINQPYYYDKDDNKLIRLDNVTAQMITKKKTLGLKGAKQLLSMDAASSKIRFTQKKDIVFIIKTSGDVIDLTSYIRLYQFLPDGTKREVTVNTKEGMLTDKDEAKGKLMSFSVKLISNDNYQLQIPDQLEAGEYGFVWVKNMELKEFTVFAFGIDWKNSD